MKAKEILETASNLVTGDRHEQHGDMAQNHKNIALLWSAYLEIPITPAQAAGMMILLKVARTKLGEPNPDNFVDCCGYAAIMGELCQ